MGITARLFAALIALIAGLGLTVQFSASYGQLESVPQTIWVMLRYFTVTTNLMVAVLFTGIALGDSRFSRPGLVGGITLAMLLVGVVYGLLLRGLVELSGGAVLADFLLHTVTPIVVAAYWLVFAAKGHLRRRHPPLWAVYPLVYFIYALARGLHDGNYAYPFMNAERIGWAGVLTNGVLMAAAFMIAGYAMVWIDGRFRRGRR